MVTWPCHLTYTRPIVAWWCHLMSIHPVATWPDTRMTSGRILTTSPASPTAWIIWTDWTTRWPQTSVLCIKGNQFRQINRTLSSLLQGPEMLTYQPNSESCLIGCYNTDEMEQKNFPGQVTQHLYSSSAELLAIHLSILQLKPYFWVQNFKKIASLCSMDGCYGPLAQQDTTIQWYRPARNLGKELFSLETLLLTALSTSSHISGNME